MTTPPFCAIFMLTSISRPRRRLRLPPRRLKPPPPNPRPSLLKLPRLRKMKVTKRAPPEVIRRKRRRRRLLPNPLSLPLLPRARRSLPISLLCRPLWRNGDDWRRRLRRLRRRD